jgi:hypothetical protein
MLALRRHVRSLAAVGKLHSLRLITAGHVGLRVWVVSRKMLVFRPPKVESMSAMARRPLSRSSSMTGGLGRGKCGERGVGLGRYREVNQAATAEVT